MPANRAVTGGKAKWRLFLLCATCCMPPLSATAMAKCNCSSCPCVDNPPLLLIPPIQAAITKKQASTAKEGLEELETRVLTRPVEPSEVGQPDTEPVVSNIDAARKAIDRQNWEDAQRLTNDINTQLKNSPARP
jgi:hypothetical protein